MQAALTEIQRIPTSGARAVAAFTVAGRQLLAIPQLARDAPGSPPGMNGGDSDTELLLLQSAGGRFEPWSALPAPGGEDAEFFTIGGRSFLAVASIRTGSGPYELAAESQIFAWDRDRFVPFQTVPTFAAKQWKHWRIGERHFLGLAQGVVRPGDEDRNRDSVIYEWDGASFAPQQQIPSRWAYNWHPFRIGDTFFVAHAGLDDQPDDAARDERGRQQFAEIAGVAGRGRRDDEHVAFPALLDRDMQHPIIRRRNRDGHRRARESSAAIDRPHVRAHQARAPLRLVHGGDAVGREGARGLQRHAWGPRHDEAHASRSTTCGKTA